MGSLDYFISVRHETANAEESCLIVCLMGEINKSSFGVIRLCQNDILAAKPTKVVFSFQYVTAIEQIAIPVLLHMQGLIRMHGIALRLCQMRSDIKKTLLLGAAICFEELRESLSEAIQSFSVEKTIKKSSA